MSLSENHTAKFIDWIVNHPKIILIITLFLVTGFAIGLKNLSISNDFRVYLSEDNPQLQAFDSFESNYVKSDSATFVITAKEGDLFNKTALTLIHELTERSWLVQSAYRVSSLSNYQYSQSKDDDITTAYFIEDPEDLTNDKVKELRSIAFKEKRLVHSLLTKDGKLSVIIINLHLDKQNANASISVTEEMELVRDEFRVKYPNIQIDNGGSTAFNTTLARAVESDLSRLMPLSYLIIFVGLFIFLRSVMGASAIFVLITSCLLCTFGFFGWVAPVLTPIAGFAPSILLSIMVADSVHVLVTYFNQLRQGKTKKESVFESLSLNLMPIFVTSITTIIGFLSLNFSSSPPYRDLGNMVAFGVLIALLFSLLLLPSLLIVMPSKQTFTHKQNNWITGFAEFVINRKKELLILVTSFVVTLAIFIPSNKLSDNWSNYFDDSFPVVKLVSRIDGYLTGVNTLEYSLKSNTKKGIFDPAYLTQLDDFETWYLTQDKIVAVTSLSQLMKDLNRLMHDDDKAWESIPQSSELAAQYLLFHEFGLPEGMGLNNLVTIHKDASRFSASMTFAGSEELLAMDEKAQFWLKENAPAIKTSPATGLGIVFAHIADRNINSILMGTFLALIGISIVLMLVLKSVKYGLISLIPNLIPAVMAYGFWGMTFGFVDIALSIVACSTLGIVVDDTVHFLHKYILARKSGKNAEDSIRESFSKVGIALLTTSVVLASGFIILSVSHMNTSAVIGSLMAITLVFALVVDLLLLPPLLLYLDRDLDD
ncbi:MAG: putative RND superfamily exporter protein [Polaribacter sp.]|jgi:predicted RND superfamily exporter protein